MGLDSTVEPTLSTEQKLPVCNDWGNASEAVKFEDLHKTGDLGIFDPSPENEMEGEMIFFQQRLLCSAIALKHQSGQFIAPVYLRLFRVLELTLSAQQKLFFFFYNFFAFCLPCSLIFDSK